jgi:hypothetical protein
VANSFFIYSDSLNTGQFSIMTRVAVEALEAAFQCRTWGEYADLCGISWAQMIDDWGDEIRELTAQEDPTREADFDFGQVFGLYYVGDHMRDPCEGAYDILRRVFLSSGILETPELDAQLVWSHGSPAGHICSVGARSEEGVRILERALHEAGYTNYTFERDDSLIGRVSH